MGSYILLQITRSSIFIINEISEMGVLQMPFSYMKRAIMMFSYRSSVGIER